MSVNKEKMRKNCSLQAKNKMTDFDLMVYHEDFIKILSISVKIKKMQRYLKGLPPKLTSTFELDTSKEEPDVINFWESIKRKLCSGAKGSTVFRGTFPITDSLIDETISALTDEYKKCVGLISEKSDAQDARKVKKKKQKGEVKGKSEGISVKYSKAQTDVLINWMIDNMKNPYPKSKEINELAKKTNLTYSQVVNWTTNVRKRNLKATIEGNKKPHHFLDFLFLTYNRDKKLALTASREEGGNWKESRSVPESRAAPRNFDEDSNMSPSVYYATANSNYNTRKKNNNQFHKYWQNGAYNDYELRDQRIPCSAIYFENDNHNRFARPDCNGIEYVNFPNKLHLPMKAPDVGISSNYHPVHDTPSRDNFSFISSSSLTHTSMKKPQPMLKMSYSGSNILTKTNPLPFKTSIDGIRSEPIPIFNAKYADSFYQPEYQEDYATINEFLRQSDLAPARKKHKDEDRLIHYVDMAQVKKVQIDDVDDDRNERESKVCHLIEDNMIPTPPMTPEREGKTNNVNHHHITSAFESIENVNESNDTMSQNNDVFDDTKEIDAFYERIHQEFGSLDVFEVHLPMNCDAFTGNVDF